MGNVIAMANRFKLKLHGLDEVDVQMTKSNMLILVLVNTSKRAITVSATTSTNIATSTNSNNTTNATTITATPKGMKVKLSGDC